MPEHVSPLPLPSKFHRPSVKANEIGRNQRGEERFINTKSLSTINVRVRALHPLSSDRIGSRRADDLNETLARVVRGRPRGR